MFESASRLNPKDIFGAVFYTESVARLDYGLQRKYFSAIAKGIEGLASIKYNPEYCQFLSNELGYDLFKGIYNFQRSPLLIHVDEDYRPIQMVAITQMWPNGNFYSLGITSSVNLLKTISDEGVQVAVNHELGHFLMNASYCSASEVIDNFKTLGQRHTSYKGQWQNEFDADKLAAAINPKLNIGKFISEAGNPSERLSSYYQQGKFGKGIANILANFCAGRDTILAELGRHPKFDIGEKMNSIFKMNYSPEHPAAIRRTLENEKFVSKISSFMKQPE